MRRPTRSPGVPQQSSYQRYKRYLRDDFFYACGYCGFHENEHGGPRFFTVEHYRPKSRFPALRNAYSNLIYACSVCNGYKGDDWPAEEPLKAGKGYLDPCEHDLAEHIRPAADDRVKGSSPVGAYMVARLLLNREQLRTVRRQRRQQEEAHAQFRASVERVMSLLERRLVSTDLAGRERRDAEAELDQLRRQHAQILADWERRWEPLYGLDDYR
jgi:hypothetical protein